MTRLWVLTAALCVACGDDQFTDQEHGCPDNGDSELVTISPALIARGEAVTLTITWSVTDEFEAAQASLTTQSPPIVEVLVPLAVTTEGDFPVWQGELLNPFGVGLPAGDLAVEVEGTSVRCETTASAATSLSLE